MISHSLARMSCTLLVGVLTLESLGEGQIWEACPLGQGAIDKLALKLSPKSLQQQSTRQDTVMESDHVSQSHLVPVLIFRTRVQDIRKVKDVIHNG